MSYIVSTSILGIQTFVTRFDPSDIEVTQMTVSNCLTVSSFAARRGLPLWAEYLLTYWLSISLFQTSPQ